MNRTRVTAPARQGRRVAGVLMLGVIGLSACASSTVSSKVVPAESNDGQQQSEPATESTVEPRDRAALDRGAQPTTTNETVPSTSIVEPPTSAPDIAPSEPAAFAYVPPEPVVVRALDVPLVAVGTSDGNETERVQARLLELGFWLQGTDGDYGLTTTQAVMAFQKFHGVPATAAVDDQTAELMSAAGPRATGLANAGTLVEIDKSRQLLFIVQDGLATWVLNSSTGSEIPYEAVNDKDPTKTERGDAVTPVGLYHTERERPEGWWAGDLGEIYRPKYFVGGIAVHGSNSIPNYPASHGCVRVSVPAMDFIWESELMPLGINVWVHGDIPAA